MTAQGTTLQWDRLSPVTFTGDTDAAIVAANAAAIIFLPSIINPPYLMIRFYFHYAKNFDIIQQYYDKGTKKRNKNKGCRQITKRQPIFLLCQISVNAHKHIYYSRIFVKIPQNVIYFGYGL